MGWKYKIAKRDIGYSIYRVSKENKVIKLERLYKNKFVLYKGFASTFYSLKDAISALISLKAKWN